MFPTYPEGWDSCQRADRVTEPHLITKSSFVLSFATTPHPGAVVPRMLGGHRAPTATPGMAKKRVLVQGELHFPFLTAEKACLGPPRINKTRSPSSRGHDLLHQAFPSHAAGIALRRPRSAAISREQGPAEPPAGTGLGSSCQIPSGRLSKKPSCSRAGDAPRRKSTGSGKTNRGRGGGGGGSWGWEASLGCREPKPFPDSMQTGIKRGR